MTTIEGRTIYLGFVHLKDLERRSIDKVLRERERHGLFIGLDDFCDRVNLSKEQLEILIRVGAFRFTERSKKQLYWEAAMLQNKEVPVATETLFREPRREYQMPVLEDRQVEEAYDQIELIGFPLCNPFNLLDYPGGSSVLAEDLSKCEGEVVRIIGYYVTSKPVRTVNGKRMFFGTFLDGAGDDFDTVHFPPVVKRYPFRGAGFYLLQGKVVSDFGVCSIEVAVMEKLGLLADPRADG